MNEPFSLIDLSGQTLRGYQFGKVIGSGGYGKVYEATETAVDRQVAIKVILPQHASQTEFVQRFEGEARLVAQLEHPHIVPLYTYWQDESGAYLVMRYIKGGSLREMLNRQGAISLAQTFRIVEQIGEALHAAHEAGVVHRDIKPDNILIDERGNAYLTDFGIAKQLNRPDALPEGDLIMGTFAYLSPEQIQAEPVMPQSDIYSLGILLYEMLAGKHPYAGLPVNLMVMEHLQTPLPILTQERADLPEPLNGILKHATEKTPEFRYANTPALVEDLRSALAMVSTERMRVRVQTTGRGVESTTARQRKSPKTPEGRNRYAMLQNVRKFWIEGVLENSLHGAALIELGMKSSSLAVDNPWDTILRRPDGMDETLDADAQILDVFDQLNGKFLILGDPGGGKTTTLLELARELLFRAEMDDEHPIPVVLNLSSWGEKQSPLPEWIQDELHLKYQVPKPVAVKWVENEMLLLLLDGLDEVAANLRDDCITAINEYRSQHGFVDVVVSSRIKDYEALTNTLQLNGAVVIQPLTNEQIDHYLATLGPDLSLARDLLNHDANLRELAQSPLMLSIFIMAYRGTSRDALPNFDDIEAQRQNLFSIYVQRMIGRRTQNAPYSQEHVLRYLSWLGKQMQQHTLSVFQIEELQPSWANEEQMARYKRRVLIYNQIGSHIFFGISTYFFGTLFGLPLWVFFPIFLVFATIIAWMFSTHAWKRNILHIINAGVIGLAWGASTWIAYSPTVGIMAFFISLVAFSGYNLGVANAYRSRGGDIDHIPIVEFLRFSRKSLSFRSFATGFVFGSINSGLLFYLLLRNDFHPIPFTIGIIVSGLLYMLPLAYQNALASGEITMRTEPNQGMRATFAFANLIAGLTFSTSLVSLVGGFIAGVPLGQLVALLLAAGTILPYINWMVNGGIPTYQHVALRQVLKADGDIPQNLSEFLNYATSLILMRKVGGGYIFIHRYLLEYFAKQYKPMPAAAGD